MYMFETFKSQKDLEKLANEILLKVAEKTFDYHNKIYWNPKVNFDGEYWKDRDFNPEDMLNIKYRAYGVPEGWVDGAIYQVAYCSSSQLYFHGYNKIFNHGDIKLEWAEENKYVFAKLEPVYLSETKVDLDEISNMLLVKDVKINFSETKSKDNKGTFIDGEFPSIYLYYNPNVFKSLRDKKKRSDNFTYKDIYFDIFYDFFSSLLHELQHAYDSYRSGGKAFDKQIKDEKYREELKKKQTLLQRREELVEDEINFVNSVSKKYLNFPHEINARFTQAVKDTSFWEFDVDVEKEEEISKMIDFRKVFKDFKRKFDGWNILSEEDKYKLRRKLSQFWYLEKDWIKKKNI